jgi:hypothetical protein
MGVRGYKRMIHHPCQLLLVARACRGVQQSQVPGYTFNADALASTGPLLSVFSTLFPVLPLSILTRFFRPKYIP